MPTAHPVGTDKETDMARRPLAAAMIVGASALVLTGCIPLPPAIPTAVPAGPTESSSDAPSEPSTGAFDFTVDDGAGDTWAFSVTGLEANPPMESGTAEPGTYFVGILFDGEHLAGSADFSTCFDVFVVGSDGVEYGWAQGVLPAVDDLYFADPTAFTQARAVVQLPEGVDPTQVILRTRFGPGEEIVVDVQ